jgi:tetratricopeptide (TPR) repeat protein
MYTGDGLCRQLMNGGKRESAFLLCREIAARSPNASWAIKRSGFLWLDKCTTTTTSNGLEQQEEVQQEYQQQYAEQASNSFQKVLRVRPGDAACWEGLGAAYQLQGRLTAALKAHSRAIQLDEGRVYAAVQCGRLHLALGSLPEALESFQSAIKTEQGKSQGEREGADGVENNETSIKTNSINPAALLGAAQVEIAIAAVDIGLGATIAAADTLGNAAGHAYTCATTVGYSTIHSAWKLVGDALLLHTETSPSEKTREIVHGKILLNNSRRRGGGDGEKDTTIITATTSSGNNASVSELLESWKGRIHAVKAASRAYAKALFLRPSNAGSWRDVALALHHQALLVDQVLPHTNDNDDYDKQSSLGLSQQAERMLHAAIRASPTSSSTWAALGIVLPLHTPSFAKKEYALSRALQLDPRNTTAWVALSRLYLSTGELGLAQDALRNARTHDPTESSIWDAMSAVAAASGDYESGLEYAEHSMLLGGGNHGSRRRSGGEGMMAFVYGAIMHTGLMMSMKGALYAVAKKLPVVKPLEAGAHVACGLACESRGDWNGTVGCYNTALELLVSSDDSSNSNGRREVECNLARALAGAGECEEAIALYEKLLIVSPSSYVAAAETWLGYARALLLSCCGESRSESQAKQRAVLVLEKAMVIVEQHAIPAAVAQRNGDCAVEAIALLLQIEYIRTSGDCGDVDVLSVCLTKYLPLLGGMDNPPPEKEKVERLWCIAGAIIATTGNVEKTVDCLYQATTSSSSSSSSSSLPAPHSAAFENNMQCIVAAAALLSASSSTEHHQQHITTSAERYLTKAIHTSPWNVPLRTSLAAILSDSTRTNGTALRSKLASRVVSLNQALSTINNKDTTNTILPWGISAVETAIEARTSSLLNNSTTSKKTIHKELVVLAKYLHAHPADAKSWYLGAVLATQRASLNVSNGGGSNSRSCYYYYAMALIWCRSALERIQQKLHTKDNNINAMWQLMKARVQLCMSDCLLHSHVTGATSNGDNKKSDSGGGALLLAESVHQCVIKAQKEEEEGGGGGGGNGSLLGAIAAAAQRQIARCHWAEGSIQSAEDMYKQAIQQHNDMLSVLELSQLLLTSSPGDGGEGKQKAAELLRSHATSSPLSHKAALMMQLALTHASLQDWEQAKEPVRNMMTMATLTAAGGDALLHSEYKEHSYTAATVLAIVCLQQALFQQQQQQQQQQQEIDGRGPASIQLIGEARRALLDTINNNYENDAVVVRTLLAQIESVGTTRKKEEKVAAHINIVKDVMSDGDGDNVDASHQLLQFLNTLL